MRIPDLSREPNKLQLAINNALERQEAQKVVFIIPGKAKGKQRPRMTKNGFAYTPKETKNHEAFIRYLANEQMRGYSLMTGAVQMVIRCYLEIPESYSNKKREAALSGALLPTKKPDYDNIAKLICDACNKVVYKDDAQICFAHFFKGYAPEGRTEVEIEQRRLVHV